MGEIEGTVEQLTTEREEQMGGEHKKLTAHVDELSKTLVKVTSSWQNKQESVKEETDAVKSLQKTVTDLEKSAESKVRSKHYRVFRTPIVYRSRTPIVYVYRSRR